MDKPRIDILIEGFADEAKLADHGTARYRPNIVLVRTEGAVIVVDPGTVEQQNEIVDALAKCNVAVADVTHVVQTHHHIDHNRNAGMFPNIPFISALESWNGIDYTTTMPTMPEGIRIEKTPGHTYDSLTIFVDTEEGVVAICGDLMWYEGDTRSEKDAEDIDTLKQSREHVLAKADFVIPGHGPQFSIKKTYGTAS